MAIYRTHLLNAAQVGPRVPPPFGVTRAGRGGGGGWDDNFWLEKYKSGERHRIWVPHGRPGPAPRQSPPPRRASWTRGSTPCCCGSCGRRSEGQDGGQARHPPTTHTPRQAIKLEKPRVPISCPRPQPGRVEVAGPAPSGDLRGGDTPGGLAAPTVGPGHPHHVPGQDWADHRPALVPVKPQPHIASAPHSAGPHIAPVPYSTGPCTASAP